MLITWSSRSVITSAVMVSSFRDSQLRLETKRSGAMFADVFVTYTTNCNGLYDHYFPSSEVGLIQEVAILWSRRIPCTD